MHGYSCLLLWVFRQSRVAERIKGHRDRSCNWLVIPTLRCSVCCPCCCVMLSLLLCQLLNLLNSCNYLTCDLNTQNFIQAYLFTFQLSNGRINQSLNVFFICTSESPRQPLFCISSKEWVLLSREGYQEIFFILAMLILWGWRVGGIFLFVVPLTCLLSRKKN